MLNIRYAPVSRYVLLDGSSLSACLPSVCLWCLVDALQLHSSVPTISCNTNDHRSPCPILLTPPGALTIRVASPSMGSVLPDIYTCKGSGESPAVSWDGIPPGTKSLVLILDDPDAPNGRFTHWIVFNIPPESRELTQAQPNTKVLANGAQQGDTSTGSRGYYPPCPPIRVNTPLYVQVVCS